MKSILTAAAAAGISLCAATAAQAAPLPTWFGEYVWEESLGRIGGDTKAEGLAAFVTYQLSIGPGNGPTGCRLTAEGYQRYEQMACTAMPQMNSLVIKFYSSDGGRERYRLGAPLFTMTRNGRAITTQLRAMTDSNGAARRGVLFRRTR